MNICSVRFLKLKFKEVHFIPRLHNQSCWTKTQPQVSEFQVPFLTKCLRQNQAYCIRSQGKVDTVNHVITLESKGQFLFWFILILVFCLFLRRTVYKFIGGMVQLLKLGKKISSHTHYQRTEDSVSKTEVIKEAPTHIPWIVSGTWLQFFECPWC